MLLIDAICVGQHAQDFPVPNAQNNSDEDGPPGVTDCLLGEANRIGSASDSAGEIQLVDESIELTENILATGRPAFCPRRWTTRARIPLRILLARSSDSSL